MANTKTFVGLDAHASVTQAATLDRETGELTFQRISGDPLRALDFLESLRRLFLGQPADAGRARVESADPATHRRS